MSAAIHNVTVSTSTFHALRLVSRIDGVSPDAVVEQVVLAYLETRLEAIHEAHHEEERAGRGGRVIDLAARRTAQRPTRSPRSAGREADLP